jgi:hypothetical protein
MLMVNIREMGVAVFEDLVTVPVAVRFPGGI